MFFDRKDRETQNNLHLLCNKCCDYLKSQLNKEDFKGAAAHFKNIVKGWNVADCGMRIVKSFKGEGIFALEIYATFPDGSGYEMKNYICHGSKDELAEYLSRDEMKKEMIETFAHFSEAIADKL